MFDLLAHSSPNLFSFITSIFRNAVLLATPPPLPISARTFPKTMMWAMLLVIPCLLLALSTAVAFMFLVVLFVTAQTSETRNIGSSIKDSNSLLDQMGGLPSFGLLPTPACGRCSRYRLRQGCRASQGHPGQPEGSVLRVFGSSE